MIQPTQAQRDAMERIEQFRADDNEWLLTVTGAAGTGKTTMIGMIRDTLRHAVIAAPTNKAVGALRQRGFTNATTVDRVINKKRYLPIHRAPTPIEIAFYKEEGADVPPFIIEETYERIDNEETGLVVIVDEASMTDMDTLSRLHLLYKKIIMIGDGFQLPPVEGEAWFQLWSHDITLTEPVRTTAESQIYKLANMIRRQDKNWRTYPWDPQEVTIIPHWRGSQLALGMLKDADVVLAHKNDTCDGLNPLIRSLRQLEAYDDPTRPTKGDFLLSWVNTKELYKSERYEVTGASSLPAGYMVRMVNENGERLLVAVNKATLQQQTSTIRVDKFHKFSFGWCVTGHKSQSGEWPRVVVLESDKSKRHPDYWNWLYTCVSRAKKHVTIMY